LVLDGKPPAGGIIRFMLRRSVREATAPKSARVHRFPLASITSGNDIAALMRTAALLIAAPAPLLRQDAEISNEQLVVWIPTRNATATRRWLASSYAVVQLLKVTGRFLPTLAWLLF
jgi:hypothetical protein